MDGPSPPLQPWVIAEVDTSNHEHQPLRVQGFAFSKKKKERKKIREKKKTKMKKKLLNYHFSRGIALPHAINHADLR